MIQLQLKGKTYTVEQFQALTGLHWQSIYKYLRAGLTPEQLLEKRIARLQSGRRYGRLW